MNAMLTHAGTVASARLVILFTDCAVAGHGIMAGVLLRWRNWFRNGLHGRPASVAAVRIDDLVGRQVHACALDSAKVDVTLPAGTYHITIDQRSARRRFTVALDEGTTVELQVAPAALAPRPDRRPLHAVDWRRPSP
jgi:hypothetical protein